jgi:peptide-methionine (S)-S-oxide reductase
MKTPIRSIKTAAFTAALLLIFTGTLFSVSFPNPPAEKARIPKGLQTAVLSGGCFWGVQGVFERLKGVTDTVAGYSGGSVKKPSYEMVSTGTTGHAETVKITYDPAVISYGTLLKVFFSVVHDPTELNFQGPDDGTQYRSVIFYTTADQKSTAEEYIKELNTAKVYKRPIVTQLVPFTAFYKAEEYHQHFLDNNKHYPYIVVSDLPKIAALNRAFPDLVANPD